METSTRIFLNRWFLGILCTGVLALTCSFLAVHVFDLKPCTLCKMQRIPYALLAANAGLGLISGFKEGFYKVVLCCLALGVVLGFIHFLVQMGMVPDFCSSTRGFNSSEEFLNTLQSPKCSKVNWSILGVPVSLLNAILHGSVLGMSIRSKFKKKLIRSTP
ncbi:MAG: disulfide bond formation protein B [Chlamydiia bacterium]|nr:disulfide bond formation protein B [Chlamydiia bacterium]